MDEQGNCTNHKQVLGSSVTFSARARQVSEPIDDRCQSQLTQPINYAASDNTETGTVYIAT